MPAGPTRAAQVVLVPHAAQPLDDRRERGVVPVAVLVARAGREGGRRVGEGRQDRVVRRAGRDGAEARRQERLGRAGGVREELPDGGAPRRVAVGVVGQHAGERVVEREPPRADELGDRDAGEHLPDGRRVELRRVGVGQPALAVREPHGLVHEHAVAVRDEHHARELVRVGRLPHPPADHGRDRVVGERPRGPGRRRRAHPGRVHGVDADLGEARGVARCGHELQADEARRAARPGEDAERRAGHAGALDVEATALRVERDQGAPSRARVAVGHRAAGEVGVDEAADGGAVAGVDHLDEPLAEAAQGRVGEGRGGAGVAGGGGLRVGGRRGGAGEADGGGEAAERGGGGSGHGGLAEGGMGAVHPLNTARRLAV
jgi:hypothetical protein